MLLEQGVFVGGVARSVSDNLKFEKKCQILARLASTSTADENCRYRGLRPNNGGLSKAADGLYA